MDQETLSPVISDVSGSVEPVLAGGRNGSEDGDAPLSGVIKDIAVLDLTGLKTEADVRRIEKITGCAVVLIPASLNAALMTIPMEDVAAVAPVPEGANVKLHIGQIKLTGEAFANVNGSPDDVLGVVGQLVITTPVQKVGFKDVMIVGQVIAPHGSEAALGSALSRLTGQVTYYSGTPRIFTGNDSFSNEFFDLLPNPVTMILAGDFTFETDVKKELLKEKVTEIVLAGALKVPRALLPLVQVLTVEKAGEIDALDDGDEEDRKAGDGGSVVGNG